MTAPTSTTAGFALGVQKLKGTAASTGYTLGRMQKSGLNERFDKADAENEHRGASGRPTTLQSRAVNTCYIGQFSGTWALYPDMIGHALLMSGFECVTQAQGTVTTSQQVQTITMTASGGTWILTLNGESTAALAYNISTANLQTAIVALTSVGAGNCVVSGTPGSSYVLTFGSGKANYTLPTAQINTDSLTGGSATVANTTPCAGDYYEHVFKLAKRGYARWGTVLAAIDEGANKWERRLTDARFNSLKITADKKGIVCDGSGYGLTLAAAAGTETKVAETGYKISPATGAHSLTISSTELGVTPRTNEIVIAQSLAEDDQKLHTFGRADLPITGNAISGVLGGLDISYAVYKKLNWGGTSGTGPAVALTEGVLGYNFVSAAYVSGTTPYKFQVAVPVAELTLSAPQASGADLIRCDLTWRMLDLDSTEPITITLVNGKQHYCGS